MFCKIMSNIHFYLVFINFGGDFFWFEATHGVNRKSIVLFFAIKYFTFDIWSSNQVNKGT